MDTTEEMEAKILSAQPEALEEPSYAAYDSVTPLSVNRVFPPSGQRSPAALADRLSHRSTKTSGILVRA